VVDEIASGGTPPAGTVCITFDDGYLDNLTVAAPILEKHRLPATLFLATGYVERAEAQWADALHCLFKYSTRPVSADRALLQRRLLEADRDERTRLLGELERQLVPAVKAPRLTMNWDDARKLRSRYPGFDIGGHTRNHIDLRARRGEAARAEIAGCGEDLRRELGLEPGHFAFPYERWCAETRDLVIASGWKSALGMGTAFRITPASDRFALPRVESTGSMTALRFKTSGAYPGALALLGLT
jgi:peptidoglycan/xylan/chitin deacetylase (PgdA/CDA1 family)